MNSAHPDALVGASQSTGQGAGIMADGFEDYRQALVVAAARSGNLPGEQIREVEAKLGDLSRMMNLAADKGVLDAARARDEKVDQDQASRVAAILLTGGVIVAPLSPGPAAGAMAYAAGVSEVQAVAGQMLAGEPCTENFDQARDQLTAQIADSYDHDRLLYLHTAADVFNVTLTDPPAGTPVGSPDWETWYEQSRTHVNANASSSYDVQEQPNHLQWERQANNPPKGSGH